MVKTTGKNYFFKKYKPRRTENIRGDRRETGDDDKFLKARERMEGW